MSSRRLLHGAPRPDRERVRGDDWRASAFCAGHDPERFFITGDGDAWTKKAGRAQAADLRAICKPCPVVAECLADALGLHDKRTKDNDGFRAGMTPQQRNRWQRRQRDRARAEETA